MVFNPQRYCVNFFVSFAVAVGALRLIDHVVAAPLGGDPLLQPLWAAALRKYPWLLEHIGFGAVCGAGGFFVACIYFTFLDVGHSVSTKVQKQFWPTARDMLLAGVPQVILYAGGNWVWYNYGYQKMALPEQAPRLPVLAEQLLVAFVCGDFLIYWEHRIMHKYHFLRTHIHSWHHSYTAPFSWAGGVVHPLEDLVVVATQITAPILFRHHPLSFWIFAFTWAICLIEEHSGHDVCWAPYNWMPYTRCPLGGGAAPHDIHHYKVTKNFAFVLCVWDHLFNTFEPVKEVPQIPPSMMVTQIPPSLMTASGMKSD